MHGESEKGKKSECLVCCMLGAEVFQYNIIIYLIYDVYNA